jgi:hypothetical protein
MGILLRTLEKSTISGLTHAEKVTFLFLYPLYSELCTIIFECVVASNIKAESTTPF